MKKFVTIYCWIGILFPILLSASIIYAGQQSIFNFSDRLSDAALPFFAYLIGIPSLYLIIKYPPANEKLLKVLSLTSLLFFLMGLGIFMYLDFFPPSISDIKKTTEIPSYLMLTFLSIPFLLFKLSGIGNCLTFILHYFFLLKGKRFSFRQNFLPEGLHLIMTFGVVISLSFELIINVWYLFQTDRYIFENNINEEILFSLSNYPLTILLFYLPEIITLLYLVSTCILINRNTMKSPLHITLITLSTFLLLAVIVNLSFFYTSSFLDFQLHDTYFVISYNSLLKLLLLLVAFLAGLYQFIFFSDYRINLVLGFLHIAITLLGFVLIWSILSNLPSRPITSYENIDTYEDIIDVRRFESSLQFVLSLPFLFLGVGQLILAFNYFFNNFFRKTS